jgi:hypothetical protein
VINDTQCVEETTLDGSCTWIYKYEDATKTDGTCVPKYFNEYLCNDLNRTTQCVNGGNLGVLLNECGLYYNIEENTNTCKKLCEKITSSSTCEAHDRINDCFWLDGNSTDKTPEKCINKVSIIYLILHIYM